MRRIFMVLALLVLAGCATSADLAVREAERRVEQFASAGAAISVDLIENGRVGADEQRRMETEATRQIFKSCAPSYFSSINEAALAISGADLNEAALFDRILLVDNALTLCAAQFGVKAQMLAEVDGVDMPTLSYLKEYFAAGRDLHAAINYRNEVQRQFYASGLASSTIYVGPYIQTDGTFVNGHLRTTPNYTCADNLNGCR